MTNRMIKNSSYGRWLCWYVCLGIWVCQKAAVVFIENTFIELLVIVLITLLGALLYSKSIDYIIDKELSDYDLTTIKILIDIFTTLKEKNKELQEIKEENEQLKEKIKILEAKNFEKCPFRYSDIGCDYCDYRDRNLKDEVEEDDDK